MIRRKLRKVDDDKPAHPTLMVMSLVVVTGIIVATFVIGICIVIQVPIALHAVSSVHH